MRHESGNGQADQVQDGSAQGKIGGIMEVTADVPFRILAVGQSEPADVTSAATIQREYLAA